MKIKKSQLKKVIKEVISETDTGKPPLPHKLTVGGKYAAVDNGEVKITNITVAIWPSGRTSTNIQYTWRKDGKSGKGCFP